jgi:hypothetical protein
MQASQRQPRRKGTRSFVLRSCSIQAVLAYALIVADELTCVLLDPQGRLVRTFFSGSERSRGEHQEQLDLSGIASGEYLLELRGDRIRAVERVP